MSTLTLSSNPTNRLARTAASTPARAHRRAVYRRRRIVAAVLAFMIAAVVVGAGNELVGHVTGASTVPAADADVEPVKYVVQSGDTVWSIAEGLAVGDIRPVVDDLTEAAGGSITPGQVLEIPARLVP